VISKKFRERKALAGDFKAFESFQLRIRFSASDLAKFRGFGGFAESTAEKSS
jgi:hypothetical protein